MECDEQWRSQEFQNGVAKFSFVKIETWDPHRCGRGSYGTHSVYVHIFYILKLTKKKNFDPRGPTNHFF